MKVSKYCEAIAAYSQAAARPASLSSGLGSVAVLRYSGSPEQSAPAAVDNVNYNVYHAVEDFLYLDGKDRSSSYEALSKEDKSKFLKAVSSLASQGVLDKSRLDGLNGESDSASLIQDDYRKSLFFSDKRYKSDGKAS